MKTRQLAAVACAVGLLALSSAWATTTVNFGGNTAPSGAHFRNGFGPPVCTFSGTSASCTGTAIDGVGNNDATLVLAVNYQATVQCRNNGGKIVNVKTQVKTTSTSDDLTDVRNGTLYVSQINPSAPPSDQTFMDAAVCPNGNWTKLLQGTASITGLTYTLTFIGYLDPAILIVL